MLQNHPHEHRTTAVLGFGLVGEHQQMLEAKVSGLCVCILTMLANNFKEQKNEIIFFILYFSVIMKYIIALTICMAHTNFSFAQKDMPGEYSLTSVMETASGLLLKEDSTFQFYFSYGALDRYGSGKWSVHDNVVILDSKPYPGKDFKLMTSTFEKNKPVTITIEGQNSNLYRLVYCRIKTPTGDSIINADEAGMMVLPYPVISFQLLCELCSERISSFAIDSEKYNNYVFNFEPWITEVFFKAFPLRFAGDHLEGKHPLLDDKEYNFNREH